MFVCRRPCYCCRPHEELLFADPILLSDSDDIGGGSTSTSDDGFGSGSNNGSGRSELGSEKKETAFAGSNGNLEDDDDYFEEVMALFSDDQFKGSTRSVRHPPNGGEQGAPHRAASFVNGLVQSPWCACVCS